MEHAARSFTRATATSLAAAAAATAAAAAATTTATTTITATSSSTPSMTPSPPFSYTNTAKLPIEVVKRLIAAVERRPNLWLRSNINGQKRCDITPLWYEVSQDVNLPVDICRIKWGHLRDNFRKVYIRNHLTDATPTTWRFYNDMRFMEKPVAENIVHQSRTNRKSGIWNTPNGFGIDFKDDKSNVAVPICELTEVYDRELHQPSFSDISAFFENSRHSPPLKRIKFEGKGLMNFAANMSSTSDYGTPDNEHSADNEELNDDDFDEDAATDENDAESSTENVKLKTVPAGNSGVFTIEVLDDDEEEQKKADEAATFKTQDSSSLPEGESGNTNGLSYKYITADTATNTDACNPEAQADDADRMFLLSLLPFMQRVDERRKLRVRQKLQSVLIEEFG